jgi:hypothetical protein
LWSGRGGRLPEGVDFEVTVDELLLLLLLLLGVVA